MEQLSSHEENLKELKQSMDVDKRGRNFHLLNLPWEILLRVFPLAHERCEDEEEEEEEGRKSCANRNGREEENSCNRRVNQITSIFNSYFNRNFIEKTFSFVGRANFFAIPLRCHPSPGIGRITYQEKQKFMDFIWIPSWWSAHVVSIRRRKESSFALKIFD